MLFSNLLIFCLISISKASRIEVPKETPFKPINPALFDYLKSFTGSYIEATKKISLPDGTYNDDLIHQATMIVLPDFITTASIMGDSTPSTSFALKDSFNLVKNALNLEVDKFKAAVTLNLLTELTKSCVRHTVKGEDSVVSNEELRARWTTAKIVKVLIYECCTLDICDIPEKQALILFESIYRYAFQDHRYDKAFFKLNSSITANSMAKFFDKVIKYFDPKRQALPVGRMFEQDCEINTANIRYLTDLYQKIVELVDPEDDKVLYCRHINMIITTVIGFAPIDPFIDVLLQTLLHIDPLELVTSANFIQNALIALPRAINQNSMLLICFLKVIITDEVISQIPENFEVEFGAVMNLFDLHSYVPMEGYIKNLSDDSRNKLKQFNQAFNRYNELVNHIESYKYLAPSFTGLSRQELITLRREIDHLTENYTNTTKALYKSFWDAINDTSKILNDIIQVAIDASDSPSDAKDTLNFERFKVFQSLFNFLIENDPNCTNFELRFSRTLYYFNTKVFNFINTDNFGETVTKQLDYILIKKRLWFKPANIKLIFNFFRRSYGLDLAIKEISSLFIKILKDSASVSENYLFVKHIAGSIKITAHDAYVNHLIQEMLISAESFDSEGEVTFSKEKERLKSLIHKLIEFRELSKTEVELAKRFMVQFEVL